MHVELVLTGPRHISPKDDHFSILLPSLPFHSKWEINLVFHQSTSSSFIIFLFFSLFLSCSLSISPLFTPLGFFLCVCVFFLPVSFLSPFLCQISQQGEERRKPIKSSRKRSSLPAAATKPLYLSLLLVGTLVSTELWRWKGEGVDALVTELRDSSDSDLILAIKIAIHIIHTVGIEVRAKVIDPFSTSIHLYVRQV